MESFTKNQQEMREKFADAIGGKLGYKDFEQLTRQNMQMFERAMRMFAPFGGTMGAWGGEKETPNPFAAAFGGSTSRPPPNGAPEAAPTSSRQRDEEIRELKDQIAAMRQQIADLAQRK
jgi:polyhydroxyalkanoate synthesis regulator protein